MGDPKRTRKKFEKPGHPWQKQRIEEEKVLAKGYGLRNKREIWKAESMRKRYADQVRALIAATGGQADREKKQLMQRLYRYSLVSMDAKPDDVLSLSVKDFLERRLQTQVFRKGLARSVRQARQFIVHGHITVEDNALTVPSHLIDRNDEKHLAFNARSSLASVEHPERVTEKKMEAPKEKPKAEKVEGPKKVEEKEEKKPEKAEKKEEKAEEKKEAKVEEKKEEVKEAPKEQSKEEKQEEEKVEEVAA